MAALLPEDEVRRRGKTIEEYRLELFKQEYLPRVKPFPMVRKLLERIKADGKRIAMASSARKPSPTRILLEAAFERLHGIEASGVIAVSDTPYDAQAAGKIGLRTDRPAVRRLAGSGAPRGR